MRRPLFTPVLCQLMSSIALMAMVTGCDKAVDGSNAAASVTSRAFNDAKTTWRDLFTYHSKKPQPQMPQTRYCYQLQTDVVCYDSVQPNSTSKLIGYQDGTNISWFQPGGGSLGASGGDPVVMTSGMDGNRAANFSPAFVMTTDVPQAGMIRSTNLPPAATPTASH